MAQEVGQLVDSCHASPQLLNPQRVEPDKPCGGQRMKRVPASGLRGSAFAEERLSTIILTSPINFGRSFGNTRVEESGS